MQQSHFYTVVLGYDLEGGWPRAFPFYSIWTVTDKSLDTQVDLSVDHLREQKQYSTYKRKMRLHSKFSAKTGENVLQK